MFKSCCKIRYVFFSKLKILLIFLQIPAHLALATMEAPVLLVTMAWTSHASVTTTFMDHAVKFLVRWLTKLAEIAVKNSLYIYILHEYIHFDFICTSPCPASKKNILCAQRSSTFGTNPERHNQTFKNHWGGEEVGGWWAKGSINQLAEGAQSGDSP